MVRVVESLLVNRRTFFSNAAVHKCHEIDDVFPAPNSLRRL